MPSAHGRRGLGAARLHRFDTDSIRTRQVIGQAPVRARSRFVAGGDAGVPTPVGSEAASARSGAADCARSVTLSLPPRSPKGPSRARRSVIRRRTERRSGWPVPRSPKRHHGPGAHPRTAPDGLSRARGSGEADGPPRARRSARRSMPRRPRFAAEPPAPSPGTLDAGPPRPAGPSRVAPLHVRARTSGRRSGGKWGPVQPGGGSL